MVNTFLVLAVQLVAYVCLMVYLAMVNRNYYTDMNNRFDRIVDNLYEISDAMADMKTDMKKTNDRISAIIKAS